MKKAGIWKKLAIATVLICGLFLGGITLAQNLSEESVIGADSNEQDIEAELEKTQQQFEQIDKMSVREYYVEYLGYDPRIAADFEEAYLLHQSS